MEDYVTRKTLDDPAYVEWLVQLVRHEDDQEIAQSLKYHKCTDQDFERFYPPSRKSALAIQKLKKRQSLYCIDADQ